MKETLGARLGRLRTVHGWTQQELSERVAVSRVAISHFETDLAVPSERTIALLAGVFKLDPHTLVADTYYPDGKAQRLPLVVARYTEVEKELCLLERDLEWLRRLDDPQRTFDTCHHWLDRLACLASTCIDKYEHKLLRAAQRTVHDALHVERASRF
jgi:transcriptional regulator with XRE-family HTH domain